MNGNKYISLASNFILKRSQNKTVLYGLQNGETYDLTADQEELIMLLSGEMTITQVTNMYKQTSRKGVKVMLSQMNRLSAISLTDGPVVKRLTNNAVPNPRLESVHLEASGECNMRCVHCYQAKYVKTGESLSLVEVYNLLDDLKDLQVSRVSVSGGEPLMIPYIIDLLRGIEKRGMKISALFTNGLLIDKELVKIIRGLRSRFSFFISLDSLPGENCSFRGFSSKGSQQIIKRVIENIRLLVRNNISVVVNTVVNTENIDHLDRMYDLMNELRVASWRLGFPKMTPQFKQYGDVFNVEWLRIAESCLALLKRHLNSLMPFQIQIEYLFREELFKQGMSRLSNQDYVCDYEGRRTELCVKPNGDVVSCAYCTELPIGNIRKSKIWNIWYSAEMEKVKNIKIGHVDGCLKCDLRSLCGTGCRANAFFLHADFKHAKDDYACMAMAFFKEKVLPLLIEHKLVR